MKYGSGGRICHCKSVSVITEDYVRNTGTSLHDVLEIPQVFF